MQKNLAQWDPRIFHRKNKKMIERFIKKFTNKEIDYVKIGSKYFLKNNKLVIEKEDWED